MDLPDVLARYDGTERIQFMSASAHDVFGIDVSACIGKSIAELGLPPAAHDALRSVLRDAGTSGKQAQAEFSMTVDQVERHMLVVGAREPIRNGADDVTRSVLVAIHDVSRAAAETQHRDCLAREKQAQKNAEAAERSRDQFLAMVSHELRSPLNGIQSWAHVLESVVAMDQPLVKRALDGIKTGVRQQTHLIEGLLDATKILGGKLNLATRPYAFNEVVAAALENLHAEANDKNVTMTFNSELSDDRMNGDAERVQLVVWNLLSNAIKFTDSGGDVRITASHDGREICLSVQDNGIGLASENLPVLFEPLYQVDCSYKRGTSGMGLGLAVSRCIAEAHGGRITCSSEGIGHGSTFSAHFPCA
ncbi:MAG TPA: PAS domain-containing sensor histidine kinase [Rhodocyclaceae bacterium]|nr:PAS domain-containing sensor histidine kinase [Rhodocyclaceae bacterium]